MVLGARAFRDTKSFFIFSFNIHSKIREENEYFTYNLTNMSSEFKINFITSESGPMLSLRLHPFNNNSNNLTSCLVELTDRQELQWGIGSDWGK